MYNDSLFNAFARSFEARSQTDMSMTEYLSRRSQIRCDMPTQPND